MRNRRRQRATIPPVVLTWAPWIGLTSVLVVMVPGYLDVLDEHSTVAAKLAEAQEVPGELRALKLMLDKHEAATEELRHRTVAMHQMHEFRKSVVQLARDCGCHVRKFVAGTRVAKPWWAGESATAPPKAGAVPPPGEHIYRLESQDFSVQLGGSLADLKTFMTKLQAAGALIHTRGLRLAKSPGRDASLELNLLLFDVHHENS